MNDTMQNDRSDLLLERVLIEEASGLSVSPYWHANEDEVCFPLRQSDNKMLLWVGTGTVTTDNNGEIHWGRYRDRPAYEGWWVILLRAYGERIYASHLSFESLLTMLRSPGLKDLLKGQIDE